MSDGLIECAHCHTKLHPARAYRRGANKLCERCFVGLPVSTPLPGQQEPPPESAAPPPPLALQSQRRKQYKVMTQRDRFFRESFDPEKLEGAINSYAAHGWVVVTMATASIPGGFGGARDEIIVLFERDA